MNANEIFQTWLSSIPEHSQTCMKLNIPQLSTRPPNCKMLKSSFSFFFSKNLTKNLSSRRIDSRKSAICAPPKVPRPILRKTRLGLEDKNIFQLKYQCVYTWCFGRFLKLFAKNWQKYWRQTNWYFSWKIVLSSRPSHVFPSMGPWTDPGAHDALLRKSTVL